MVKIKKVLKLADKHVRVNGNIAVDMERTILDLEERGVKESAKEFTEKAIQQRIENIKSGNDTKLSSNLTSNITQ